MRTFSYGLVALVMVAALASIALASPPNPGMGEMGKPAPNTWVLKQHAPGAGGQNGTVVMKPNGDKTTVTLTVSNEPPGAHQPAHFHVGDCAHPGRVIYPLTDVINGKSVTVVDAPISKLAVPGNSVNVHKSAAQLNLYMACANLTSPS